MSRFDNLIKVDKNEHIFYAGWIEWDHILIPNKPNWLREIMRNIMAFQSHCLNCTSLDGCYMQDINKPPMPLHNNCDCKKKKIDYEKVKLKAKSECAIEKFTKYVFKNDHDSKGKNRIFYDLGYSVNDAEFLKNEYCKQALSQYLLGNYVLKNLDSRGQRLAIPIVLNGCKFYSGWMLYPEGRIKNTTPFGGWIK